MILGMCTVVDKIDVLVVRKRKLQPLQRSLVLRMCISLCVRNRSLICNLSRWKVEVVMV